MFDDNVNTMHRYFTMTKRKCKALPRSIREERTLKEGEGQKERASEEEHLPSVFTEREHGGSRECLPMIKKLGSTWSKESPF